ncbi:MAG: GNAT family N-acetyltransferase [Flavobacteriaceae bacterium]|nr:GNAT family N-acetyltransferase [Flavobacteriaceae bacterium]
MKFTIRKGTKSDASDILGLIQELAVFEKEPNAVIITEKDLIRDGFGDKPLYKVFVSEVKGEIVGMALYYYRFSTWKGKTLHLEDLIVKQKYRGTGIGGGLYRAFLNQALEEGVERTEWVVLDWNTPAIDFYKITGADVLNDWRIVNMNKSQIEAYLSKTQSVCIDE